MLDVSAVVKTGQIANQSQPANRSPTHILDHAVIDLSFWGNHHCPAGEFAVVEGDEQAAAAIKGFLAFNAHRKRTPVETRQRQKNGSEISELSPMAEATGAKSCDIRREPHAQEVDVVDQASAVAHAHHVAGPALARDQRVDRMFNASVAEIAEERVARTQGQERQCGRLLAQSQREQAIHHLVGSTITPHGDEVPGTTAVSITGNLRSLS